jgi:hypothetical protein
LTKRLTFFPLPPLQAPSQGKSLKVAYRLSNKSGQNIRSSAVAIMLPDHVTYTSSSAKPMGSAGTHAGGEVTWASAGAINAGKSKTYTAAMTVGEWEVRPLWSACHPQAQGFEQII